MLPYLCYGAISKKISRVNATAQAVIRRIKTGVRKQLKKAKKKSSDLFQSFLVY